MLGLTDRVPKIFGVASRAPIAPSISVDIHGNHALSAIDRSGGECLQVDQEEIIKAVRQLAGLGLLVEPASSASVAGFMQWSQRTGNQIQGSAVCVVTGSLIKWLEQAGPGLL